MQLHTLARTTKNKKKKIIGRGGTRGKTSGRGTKGQNARAGNKKRPEFRDMIKKLPKMRGYRFNSRTDKPAVINLAGLSAFAKGDTVSPATLFEKRLIRRVSGKVPPVKILGNGSLETALTFTGVTVSTAAKEKIEKAGGSVVLN